MTNETHTNATNGPDSAPVPSSLPSLSIRLNSFYNGLDSFNRRSFVKIYKYLWGVVNKQDFNTVSKWWVLRLVAESSGLSPSSLAVLSYLYMASNKGKDVVHSNRIYISGVLPGAIGKTVQRVTWDLKHAGLITRHTLDPSAPYLQRSHSRQPVFIKLTLKGVQCIEGIEKDLNKLLLNSSLDDLTGAQ